jgi:hypothetical protein
MAWNNLTPAQQAAWKKKNFNTKVSVPQSAIDKLMAGKTKSNNIKKYAGTKSPVMREAMNRFYGKGWDKGVAPKAEKPKVKPSKPTPNPKRFAPEPQAKPPVARPKAKKPDSVTRGKPITSVGGYVGRDWKGNKFKVKAGYPVKGAKNLKTNVKFTGTTVVSTRKK